MFRAELRARLASVPCSRRGCLNYASAAVPEDRTKQCYQILNVPINCNQETARRAFLELAKKYHPDSGHEAANIERFCEIEDAFRVITKKNTGSTVELENILEHDIKHTAPQHRQYLSFDGVGHGTPSQRQKQYAQVRAQKAAENVMEHRVSKAIAAENTLLKKENMANKHDIKTQYGFDRLVEDLIQEAMSKGEFDNLSGKGKPLKGQNYNPYVDFTTHKINEVLINNGFTPEWITLNKDIREEIAWMNEQLRKERARLGPLPLTDEEAARWKNVCENLVLEYTKKINSRITSFNLIVPLLNKQMFLLKFDDIAEHVLKNEKFDPKSKVQEIKSVDKVKADDAIVEFVKTVSYFFNFIYSMFKREKTKLKE